MYYGNTEALYELTENRPPVGGRQRLLCTWSCLIKKKKEKKKRGITGTKGMTLNCCKKISVGIILFKSI